MSAFKQGVPTERGLALLAKAIAGTATLDFTKIAISEDELGENLSTRTHIGTIKQEKVGVSVILNEENSTVSVSASVSNDELQKGYYVRNIGLYANDPDEGEILYSISVADESVSTLDWMPAFTGGGVASLSVDLVVDLSGTSDMTIVVDENAGATVAQVTALQNQVIQVIADLKDHNIKTYKELSTIGLEVGKETIENIVNALPLGSILMIPVNSSNNTGIYPEDGEGTLWVRFRDGNRAHFEFISTVTNKLYRGDYRLSTKTWSGWILVFDERSLPTPQQISAMPLEPFTDAVNDLNAVLTSGAHCTVLRTTTKTLNTPYNLGVTPYGTALVISYAETTTNGVQVAFISGHSKQLTYYRTLTDNVISDWTTGYLPLSGGTISGGLKVHNGYGSIGGIEQYLSLAHVDIEDITNYRNLSISNEFGIDDALVLHEVRNGKEVASYRVFGEHNVGDLSRVVTGSYVGTGVYGKDNKNSITFGFIPKYVGIYKAGYIEDAPLSNSVVHFLCGATTYCYTNAWYYGTQVDDYNPTGASSTKLNFAVSSLGELTWYTDYKNRWVFNQSPQYDFEEDSAKKHQMNESGTTYYYIAIG